MGTLPALSLQCPLCCDEKFPSHSSLKYHILSIIDNLICTACNARFDSVLELAEHIGRECKEPEPPQFASIFLENIKQEFNQENYLPENTESGLDALNPKAMTEAPINFKTEVEDVNYKNTIPAKALTSDQSKIYNHNSQQVTTDERLPLESVYMCENCNMSFNSIEEHFSKYHSGQILLLPSELKTCKTTPVTKTKVYLEARRSSSTIKKQQSVNKGGRVRINMEKNDKLLTDRQGKQECIQQVLVKRYSLKSKDLQTTAKRKTVLAQQSSSEILQGTKCHLQFDNVARNVAFFNKHPCTLPKFKKSPHCTAIPINHQGPSAHLKRHITTQGPVDNTSELSSNKAGLRVANLMHNSGENRDMLSSSGTRLEAFRKFTRQAGFKHTKTTRYFTTDAQRQRTKQLLYLLRDLEQDKPRLKCEFSIKPYQNLPPHQVHVRRHPEEASKRQDVFSRASCSSRCIL